MASPRRHPGAWLYGMKGSKDRATHGAAPGITLKDVTQPVRGDVQGGV
jgi:hypothetical protein